MNTNLTIQNITATAETVVAAGDSVSIPITGITNVKGTVDVGSNHGNRKIPFAIPDESLASVFGDGLIHIACGSVNGESCGIVNSDGAGLSIDIETGTVPQDTYGWAADWDASTSTEPVITIHCTVQSAGSITISLPFLS